MAIEFNPNRINGAANSVGKKRSVDSREEQHQAASSADKVSVSSVSPIGRAETKQLQNAEEAKSLAEQLSTQLQANPGQAHAAYGNANTQFVQNVLEAV